LAARSTRTLAEPSWALKKAIDPGGIPSLGSKLSAPI